MQACSIASPQFTALALYASPVRLPPPRPHHQVQRKPRALHRDEVRALVVQATHGLFPEHNHVLDVAQEQQALVESALHSAHTSRVRRWSAFGPHCTVHTQVQLYKYVVSSTDETSLR